MRTVTIIGVLGVLAAGGAAMGQYQYTGSQIGSPDGTAKFDGIADGQSLLGYTESGLTVSMDHIEYKWQPLGFDASGNYYPNGGDYEQAVVTQSGGGDFGALEFQVSDGWYKPDIYAWIQVLNNGVTVADYNYDVAAGDVIGVGGGGFDELRVAAYYSAAERDAHSPTGYNAIAIDNMSYGAIPAPATAGLLGLGALFAGRRRR